MPGWWGHVNKRLFNPRAVASGRWPLLEHVGRSSGATHRTPLDAHPTSDGYVFVLVYGPGADWVRNVMTAGRAHLLVDGRRVALGRPRLVGEREAFAAMTAPPRRPPRLVRIRQYLQVDTVGG